MINGLVTPGFEAVADAFAAHAEADPTHNAQLAVYLKGELILDLVAGTALQADSLLPVFSSSKGATAVAVSLLVQRGLVDLDAPMAAYWPEFAAHGKGDLPVRLVLSHQAGLTGVDGGFSLEEVMSHDALAERLAAQRPLWKPGAAFLYHAVTIGTLADELCRRTDGRPVAKVLRDDVTGPRGIDVWMGTPESEDHRFRPFEMPTAEELMPLLAELAGSVDQLDGINATAMPNGGMVGVLGRVNDVDFRRAGAPAAGVCASARGLAKLYATLTHDVGGPRLLTNDTIGQMSQLQVQGIEFGTGLEARFAVMFQKSVAPRWGWGSWQAFGHDGAGGSCAFNDPMYETAFGYTVQRLPLPGGADARALELTRVLRNCLRG